MSLSTFQVELNAPLSANQLVQVMGGGLEATPSAKITSSKPLPTPIISITREAAPSGMTICDVSPNYYIQIGTNSFPSIAPLISNTGTNLMVLVSRKLQISAAIDFGSSIPVSAKLLECSPGMLVIAIDVQIASPLTAPIFYDSRGIQCNVSTNTPAFASSLYMTYFIQYTLGNTRITPAQRLLQIEGSSKALCLRTDPFGNYVFSGTIATGSAVSSLYITDATANTTAIAKGSNTSYYCKVSATGTFATLNPMNSLIADFVLDATGQYVYILSNTALTQYDNSNNPTTLATYSSVATAFWVSQIYSDTAIIVLGNAIGTLANGTFTTKGIIPTPLSVKISSTLAIVVTASALCAFNTAMLALPRIWTLTISNITNATIGIDNTLSIAFSGNTSAIPQFTTFDGASITAIATGLTSAALYQFTNIPIIEASCTITAQPVSGVWLAAGMPSTPINLGWAADVTQSTLAALTLTPTATTLNIPLALASDTASSGTISLATPLTVLTSNATYSLPAAGASGQVKVLVAAAGSTAIVTVGGDNGRTITVSGTTGVKLVFANNTWYLI